MASKKSYLAYGVAVVVVLALVWVFMNSSMVSPLQCPGSQVYCPGVGCVSGLDKCVAGAKGGASAIFSVEKFSPMIVDCPGGTRGVDGICLG